MEVSLLVVDDPVADVRSLASAVGLRAVSMSESAFVETYMDTHDGRLWRAGWRLAQLETGRARWLRWRHVHTGEEGEARVRRKPRWQAELPEDCTAIAAAIEMRALHDIASSHGTILSFALVDKRDKTVVRLDVIKGTTGPDGATVTLPDLWRVEPLKGFASDARMVVRELDASYSAVRCGDVLDFVAERSGADPAGYSAKLNLSLSPQMSIHAAIGELLAVTHQTVRVTTTGTRADLDSEFLHDFRVAVRRARSWLARLKRWLDPALFAHLKAELGWLGRATGPTRDLDVYLLKMPDYAAALPEVDAAALAPLQQYLRRAQRREQRKLRTALDSPRFAALMQTWASFGQTPAAPGADAPVGVVANQVLARQWKKVCKGGRAIGPATPAQALHDLRIECKKLRYLLEAFASLYAHRGMRDLIRTLKRLQDNLGDFQDLEVQQASLRGFADAMGTRATPTATLVAMGRLIEQLARKQDEERERFARRWLQFDSGKNNHFAKRAFTTVIAPADPD